MRFAALAVLGLCTIVACEQRPGDETGRAVDAADTVITSEQDVDTTIVTHDTTVDVDTIRQEGDEPVARDTLDQSNPSTTTPSGDTGLTDTLQQ